MVRFPLASSPPNTQLHCPAAHFGRFNARLRREPLMRMNDSEKFVLEYLTGRGFGSVVYEPDGNVPPDFLIDGRIAVEVRRLNENEKTATGHRGLEEVSTPLTALIQKALLAIGPPRYGISWFVSYSYRRPLPPWRQLDKVLRKVLREIRDQPDLGTRRVYVADKLRLSFTPAAELHPNLLVLGSWSDHDSGGFVISDIAHNLRICMAEKSLKISKIVSRYPEWWLALDDRIGYGDLDEDDRNELQRLVRRDHPWSKIILVNPLRPSNGFEM